MKRRFFSFMPVALALGASTLSCVPDFDTERSTPPRKTVGRELYTLLCDRVGAQALREDVAGQSFHWVCHPTSKGKYASKVDATMLPPIEASTDAKGKPVSAAIQKENRARRIARVEALGRRREELIAAFDAAMPEAELALKDTSRTAAQGCDKPGDKPDKDALLKQLERTLARFFDLYKDDTIPDVTRALGAMLTTAQGDQDVQAALARLDARQGYRPTPVGLGLIRPLLAYPRLFAFSNTLLGFVSDNADPYNPEHKGQRVAGKANGEFRELLGVLQGELRLPPAEPLGPLAVGDDPASGVSLLSRPRGKIELAKQLLLYEHPDFGSKPPRYVVRRDERGYASVALADGKPVGPFTLDGAGLPQLDELGQFIVDGDPPPSPFFALGAPDGDRDDHGRALYQGKPLHDYLDTSRIYLAALLRDARPLLDPDADDDHQTLFNAMAGVPVLMGGREETPTGTASYPGASDDDKPTKLKYRRFRSEQSPLVDLAYALGQTLADPALDDALLLTRKLLAEHPQKVARLAGLGFKLKQMADQHPEAHVPEASTLWDDMLVTLGKIAHEPGLLEDLLSAFADERTVKLDKVFSAYMRNRDRISYARDPSDPANEALLNGPAYNFTKKNFDPLSTPVDRSQPDSGDNQSALQRFIHTLHDVNGLAACTKEDAVAHIKINLTDLKIPLVNLIDANVAVDYPKEPKLFDIFGQEVDAPVIQTLCAFVGAPKPKNPMPQCGILRFENVATLLLDVALGRAKFDVRDECLRKLMDNPSLTGLVGGTNAFLENISGLKGFSLQPTVPAVARMVHFETPYKGWGGFGGDGYYPKTRDFFKDIIDPIPTMVCDSAPFTDPTDGKLIPLRTCSSFSDTIRGRHQNAVFPLEQLDFVTNIQPLAAAFADHNQPLLFVELFDTMHLHWGSAQQTKAECDPGVPRSNPRWCSQDGAVTYEPLLAEMLETDLFRTLADLVTVLKDMKIARCTGRDAKGLCVSTTEGNGVQVLAEALRVLADPARSAGLVDRQGRSYAVRNDGEQGPLMPLVLLIDALKGFDAAFAKHAATGPDGEAERTRWKLARSQLVDTFFTVAGEGDAAEFTNPAMIALLPRLIDVLRAQIRAHCPQGASCTWARDELAKNLAETIDSPLTASALGLADAVRRDPQVRAEVERLVDYLLEAVVNDASDTTLAGSADLLQWLGDDTNMTPVYRMAAAALTQRPDGDQASAPGLVPASLELLTKLFAPSYDDQGDARCSSRVDPHETLAVVMKNLVTPSDDTGVAPVEVILSVIADVNRADPSQSSKLTGDDYGNMAKEIADFLLNPATGLEQVYDVIRNATVKP